MLTVKWNRLSGILIIPEPLEKGMNKAGVGEAQEMTFLWRARRGSVKEGTQRGENVLHKY